MLRDFRTRTIALATVLAGLALSGCSDTTLFAVPQQSLATVAKLKNKVLSEEERDSAIRDLSAAQDRHREDALDEIQKR